MKAMVIPREHGAWGMLLVPLVTGAVVASRSGVRVGPLTLFVFATLIRGTAWFLGGRRALDVHKLGFAELAQSLIFGTLLCVAFLV
jgi:hypothetical protein